MTTTFDKADCFLSDLQDRLAYMTTAAHQATLARCKYCAGCSEIENCPPDTYQPQSGTWYRIIYAENDKRSFVPPYQKDPPRLLEKPGTCTDWALSFYLTEPQARKQYAYLSKVMKDVDRKIGSHIAEVIINNDDGIASPANKRSGHIDLHEFTAAKLETQSTLLSAAAQMA